MFGFVLAELGVAQANQNTRLAELLIPRVKSNEPLDHNTTVKVGSRRRPTSHRWRYLLRIFARAAIRVLLTPVILAVLFALTWKGLAGIAIPTGFDRALETLADSFSGTALFLVGFSAADSLSGALNRKNLIHSLCLSFLKTVVLASVARLMAQVLHASPT